MKVNYIQCDCCGAKIKDKATAYKLYRKAINSTDEIVEIDLCDKCGSSILCCVKENQHPFMKPFVGV